MALVFSAMKAVATSAAVWLSMDVSAPVPTSEIFGGQPVEPCGWPSVVLLRGNGYLCTGNLVHPEIVLTAAHCLVPMGTATQVYFGDHANSAQVKVAVEYCEGAPDFVGNDEGTIPFSEVQHDWGFCKLASPVTDVQPIPPLFGCEADLLTPGAEIVRVGFGKETLATNAFLKREVNSHIVSTYFPDGLGRPAQLSEGGGGVGTCPGDSGGPAFIRVPETAGGDGSWRMVAIQSTQPMEDGNGDPIECGTEPNNTAVVLRAVAFVRERTGIDIAPCFDDAGAWQPTYACSGFPVDPMTGGGYWPNSCEPATDSGFSSTCGASFDDLFPDLAAPTVSFVEPDGPLALDYPGQAVPIEVRIHADDGDGWGVSHVDFDILSAESGEVLASFTDDTGTYVWEPSFPRGEFLLRAVAHDLAGNSAQTEDLTVSIGAEPPPGDSDSSGAADDDDDGDGDGGEPEDTSGAPIDVDEPVDEDADTDAEATLDAEGGQGCGCASGRVAKRPGGWTGALLVMLGGGLWRRRRRSDDR